MAMRFWGLHLAVVRFGFPVIGVDLPPYLLLGLPLGGLELTIELLLGLPLSRTQPNSGGSAIRRLGRVKQRGIRNRV